MDPNIDALLWNGRPRDATGSDRIYGVVPAIVVAIDDAKEKRHQLGMVQVRFPWLTDAGASQDLLPWARCTTFAAGHDGDGAPCGWVSTPQVHDEVLVGFEHGDVRRPYVLGQLWNPKAGGGGAAAGAGAAAGGGAAGGSGGGAQPGGGGAAAGPGGDGKDAGKGDGKQDGSAGSKDGSKDAGKPATKDDREPAKDAPPASKPGAAKRDAAKPDASKDVAQADAKEPGAEPGPDARPGAAKKDEPTPQPAPPAAKKDADDDTIRKGEVLRPPGDDGAEAKWFARLERTSPAELQPGDVLIRKVYGRMHKVRESQRLFRDGKGSNCSVHAMLYVGGGQVFEATPDGVRMRPLPSPKLVVWRPKDPRAAQSAVETARWLAGQSIRYSMQHCAEAAPHSSSWGDKAKARAAMIATRKLPAKEMMCSELVTYCFQGTLAKAYIELDAMRVAPIRLEDYLNGHPDKFAFAGALEGAPPDDDDGTFDPGALADRVAEGAERVGGAVADAAKKVGDAVGGAAGAAAKDVAAAATGAAAKVGDAAGAAAKAVSGAADSAAKAAGGAAQAVGGAAQQAAKKAESAAKDLRKKLGF